MESVAVVLFPNESDNWELEPPFSGIPLAGSNGYIFANTPFTTVGFVDYLLMETRLIDVGNTHNRIDFMQSTLSDRDENSVSLGIGGAAKLKDFNFTIADRSDLTILNIYGREIELRLYEGNEVSNDADELYSIYFRGTVTSVKNAKGDKLRISARGVVSNNNPRVRGEPYIDSDGSIQYNFIFIGESTNNSFVKLNKVDGPGGVHLSFDDSKYALKSINIKDKELDEFYPVTSNYTVEDGNIIFEGTNIVTLANGMTMTDVKVGVFDGIDFLILIEPANYLNRLVFYHPRTDGPGGGSPSNLPLAKFILTKVKTYVDPSDLKTYAIYRGSPSIIYAEWWDELVTEVMGNNVGLPFWYVIPTDTTAYDTDDALGNDLKVWSIKSEEGIKFDRYTTDINLEGGSVIESFFHGEREFRRENPVALLPIANKRQVKIRVDSEDMLVTYAEDRYDGTLIRTLDVVRGIDDTEVATHDAGAQVNVLSSDESQKPIISIRSNLKDILMSDSLIPNSDTYKDWSNREDDSIPYIWHIDKKPNQLNEFLFINLQIPDISGELVEAYILSNIDHNINASAQFPFNTYVSLQLTEHVDTSTKATEELKRLYGRVDFGYNEINMRGQTSFIDNLGMHNYTVFGLIIPTIWYPQFSIPYLYYAQSVKSGDNVVTTALSDAKHVLKGSWVIGRTSNFILSKYSAYDKDATSTDYNLESYDDLKSFQFALRASFDLYEKQRATLDIHINNMKLYAEVKAPIVDNDWYGNVKNLTNGDDQGTVIVDTFALGLNGSIYLTENKKYLFAESDTIPFIVFELSLTGILTELERVTLPDYADIATGYIGRLGGTKIAKINPTLVTEYKWVETVEEGDLTFPAFDTTIKDNVYLKAVNIGNLVEDADQFVITLTDGTINVWKKEESEDGNPVNVLRRLLIDYAKYPPELIDDNENPLIATSFGRVRQNRNSSRNKCTFIIEKELNANVLIDRLCKNYGMVLYENDEGKVALADLFPPNDDQVTVVLDDSSIILNSKKIPEIQEDHIDMRYLITGMDLRFSPLGDRFQEEILNEDIDDRHATLMERSTLYTNFSSEVAFHHLSTYDDATALWCSYLKLLFHTRPTRIFKIKTVISFAQRDLCSWLTIDSSHIENTDDKIYLIIGKKTITPVGSKRSYSELELFEFSWSKNAAALQIQEVYNEAFNENHIEVITDIDQIQEVYDGSN